MISRMVVCLGLIALGLARVAWGEGPAIEYEFPQFGQAAPAAEPGRIDSPRDAVDDGYRLSEEQRRWAIDRQLGLLQTLRAMQASGTVPYFDRPVPTVCRAAARRALRRRYAPPPPYPLPGYGTTIPSGLWPLAPFGAVPNDYRWARQPTGHEKIWTGPNSYVYRPLYPESADRTPPEPAGQPIPATPRLADLPKAQANEVPRQFAPGEAPEIPEPPAALPPGPREL